MSSEGLFDDLRIIELGQGVSAAFCAKLFADLGAEVIKVEPPDGEIARRRGPFAGDEPGPERSGLFAYLNTSKYGVTLDAGSDKGREIFTELVTISDILIENNSPAWMAEAQLDYKHLQKSNPSLIMTSITPFGQDGPWRDYLGNDFIVQHTSGVAFHNGARVKDTEAQPPILIPGFMGEFAGGLAAASATMCALFGQMAGDEGAHVDVALQQALAMNLQVDVTRVTYADQVPSRSASAIPPVPFVGQQPAADGYIDYVVRTQEQWHNMLDVLGNPEWAKSELFATLKSRSQYWDALEPLIQQETRRFTKEHLFRESQAKGVSAAAVNTVADAAKAEHFQDRGSFAEFEHPVLGKLRCPGPPIRFDGDFWGIRRPAPLLGQHNAEIYSKRLGYQDKDLAALSKAGVI